MAGIDREELRHLVRQTLKETLGREPVRLPPGLIDAIRAALSRSKPATVAVAVADCNDLDAFARAVLAAGDDAELKAAIVAGDVHFVPAAEKPAAAGAPPPPGGSASFDKGVLGENKVVELSRKGRRIVIGKGVVVTPLAREKARQLKVELVRQKP